MLRKKGLVGIKDTVSKLIRNVVAPDGPAVVRPVVSGSARILGSFPPINEWERVGKKGSYYIHDGYRPRTEGLYFDDLSNEGEWQLEVYQFAREIRDRESLKSVADLGCGSASKLVTYFSEFLTVGVDVPQTCARLRNRWPDRHWVETGFGSPLPFPVDLVIASDVIEHLLDPNELLNYIQTLRPKFIVLSTPDRNLLRSGTHNGPPKNPAHIREWSFAEFRAYVEESFDIEEHFISCTAQATQCMLCKPR